MADITMCTGIGCKNKKNCYRHLATPNKYRQSMFVTPPVKEDGSCEHFWPIHGEKDEK